MAKKLKSSRNDTRPVGPLPADYPFGNRVSESIADYAERMGVSKTAMQRRADRGSIPVLQEAPGKRREVNLYAVYLRARVKAERYVRMAS